MRARVMTEAEEKHFDYKRKQLKDTKGKLIKLFEQAEILREKLMWLECTDQPAFSWMEMKQLVKRD